jgi:hypothetical protein
MLAQIFRSIVNVAVSTLAPSPVDPLLKFDVEDEIDSFELSSSLQWVRASFVNDYVRVPSAEDTEKRIKTDQEKALYLFDSIWVNTPSCCGTVVDDVMFEAQNTFFVPNTAVITKAMQLDYQEETGSILKSCCTNIHNIHNCPLD